MRRDTSVTSLNNMATVRDPLGRGSDGHDSQQVIPSSTG